MAHCRRAAVVGRLQDFAERAEAVSVARSLDRPLLEWHIKSTSKAQQGLYEYDAVSRLRDSQLGDARVHDIRNYIVKGKLWEAFELDVQPVVLIDEIDKAAIEFPNDLLRELDRMEFYVYETCELVQAKHRPIIIIIIITSNNEKELPDALLRRCFFRYIRFPDDATMRRIIEVHFPRLKQELLSEALRAEDPKRTIPLLHGALLKNEQDVMLFEQQERHEGGSKWIGTAGTSPYGHGGYNPEGVRIGGPGRQHRPVKVWEQREFRNFDDAVELGTRNLKLALRKLRRLAREGAADQLDLERTIDATARNAGLLDLKLMPERHNALKVLLFLDVGGSMDEHVRLCEEVFSAARSEFKHLEHFYFHNCPYQSLWKDNWRRHTERIATQQVLRTYGADYRAIFVGDATMNPYEITHAGASIKQWNDEAGALWLQRLSHAFPHLVWLNPEPVERWEHTASIRIVRELVGGRIFPLTIAGLEQAITSLKRRELRGLDRTG
jgi:uncharacterized protein with von Willebrand factor type A (vWA) domain